MGVTLVFVEVKREGKVVWRPMEEKDGDVEVRWWGVDGGGGVRHGGVTRVVVSVGSGDGGVMMARRLVVAIAGREVEDWVDEGGVATMEEGGVRGGRCGRRLAGIWPEMWGGAENFWRGRSLV
ncbi:hypothetical protein Tco_0851923 [Tanacetum coccineum]